MTTNGNGSCRCFDLAIAQLSWSVYIREITLTFELGESTSIRMDMAGSMPSDFLSLDSTRLPEESLTKLTRSPVVQCPKVQKSLGNLFSARRRLSGFFGLLLRMTEKALRSAPCKSPTAGSQPRSTVRLDLISTSGLSLYRRSLQQWWSSLPAWMQTSEVTDRGSDDSSAAGRFVAFHRDLLILAYLDLTTILIQAVLERERAENNVFPGKIAIREHSIRISISQMLDILHRRPSDEVHRLLAAVGPRMVRLLAAALSQTEAASARAKKDSKPLQLMKNCTDFLIRGPPCDLDFESPWSPFSVVDDLKGPTTTSSIESVDGNTIFDFEARNSQAGGATTAQTSLTSSAVGAKENTLGRTYEDAGGNPFTFSSLSMDTDPHHPADVLSILNIKKAYGSETTSKDGPCHGQCITAQASLTSLHTSDSGPASAICQSSMARGQIKMPQPVAEPLPFNEDEWMEFELEDV